MNNWTQTPDTRLQKQNWQHIGYGFLFRQRVFRALPTQRSRIFTRYFLHPPLQWFHRAEWSTTLKIAPMIPIKYFMFSSVITPTDRTKISLHLPDSKFKRSKLITTVTLQLPLSHSGTLVSCLTHTILPFSPLLLKLNVIHKYILHLLKRILYFKCPYKYIWYFFVFFFSKRKWRYRIPFCIYSSAHQYLKYNGKNNKSKNQQI